MATFTLTGPIVMPDGSTPRANYKVTVTPVVPLPGVAGAILDGIPFQTDADGDFSQIIEVVDGAGWRLRVENPRGDLLYQKVFATPTSGAISVADIIAGSYTPSLTPTQYDYVISQLGAKATTASVTALTTTVGLKADTTTVNAALALKADKSVVDGHTTQLSGLTAAQTALEQVALTIDENWISTTITAWQLGTTVIAAEAANNTHTIWQAPYDCRIEALRTSFDFFALAASDTNYWSVDLARIRAGVTTSIVTKSTKVTGGEAIAARTPWNFAGMTWDATAGTLQPGDLLVMRTSKTGTPADFRFPMNLVFKATPL